MNAALVRCMDRIFFGIKRAFHSSLRIGRRDFEDLGLTAARMDVLVAVDQAQSENRPVWQSQLRQILGYTARSTLTEMLRALERLGLTRRKRSGRDARQLEVELTPAGRERLLRARTRFWPGWAFAGPDLAKDWGTQLPDEIKAWDAYMPKVDDLDATLGNFRIALRDTATLFYPWPADD